MKTYKIYLIRHGQIQGSLDGKYIGQTDEKLSEAGEKELYELKNKCTYPEIEVLFSGSLSRCLQTCDILYPDRQPIVMDGLNEFDFGEFEGQTAEKLKDDPDFIEFLEGGEEAKAPFGESNLDFVKRICETFEKIVDALMSNGITEAGIVTHGGVISTLLSIYGSPEAPASSWRIEPGRGCLLTGNTGIWSRIKKLEVMDEIPYEIRDDETGEMKIWNHYNYDSEFYKPDFNPEYDDDEDGEN